jgi:hypothetical protein
MGIGLCLTYHEADCHLLRSCRHHTDRRCFRVRLLAKRLPGPALRGKYAFWRGPEATGTNYGGCNDACRPGQTQTQEVIHNVSVIFVEHGELYCESMDLEKTAERSVKE